LGQGGKTRVLLGLFILLIFMNFESTFGSSK